MIINCNSCGKKFVVPDQAITSSGRMVQCGSCGNKWKQYPKNEEKKPPIKKSKSITHNSKFERNFRWSKQNSTIFRFNAYCPDIRKTWTPGKNL